MGFLSVYSGVKRIVIDEERGYWIDIKEHISQGDREASERALTSMVVADGKSTVNPDVTAWRQYLVLAGIANWNLDDDNGVVWPITMESILRLPGDVYDRLWNEVESSATVRSGRDQQQFRDGSVSGNPDGNIGTAVTQ